MSQHLLRSLFVALVAIMAILSVIVAMKICNIGNAVTDGHREREVVEALIVYMEDHEGTWPANWEALEPQFRKILGWSPSTERSFEDFKHRIAVDFSADVIDLRRQSETNDKPTFRVVSAKFTKAIPPTGDPNYILYLYFRNEYSPSKSRNEKSHLSETTR